MKLTALLLANFILISGSTAIAADPPAKYIPASDGPTPSISVAPEFPPASAFLADRNLKLDPEAMSCAEVTKTISSASALASTFRKLAENSKDEKLQAIAYGKAKDFEERIVAPLQTKYTDCQTAAEGTTSGYGPVVSSQDGRGFRTRR